MKFKHWNHAYPDLELIQYVAQNLEGDDYERGALESARAQADNVSEAFGRLLQVLAETKLITKEQIEFIIEGHSVKEGE